MIRPSGRRSAAVPLPHAPRLPLPEAPRSWWNRITPWLVARAKARPATVVPRSPFVVPDYPPGVVPSREATIAQDEQINSSFTWAAQNAIYSAYAEGVVFLGYSYLATLAQRSEYRVISETIASEMTREWIELKSVGEDDKTDKIKALEDAIKRYAVQDVCHKSVLNDGFFGRGHIYVDTGDTEDRDELKMPIGNGRNGVSRRKVGRDGLKAFRAIEPIWCYPTQYDSNDPLKPDWYKPQTWFVNGKEVHRTRLLTLVGREVPDLLKPAYAFGGLSLNQMAKPYVDNWLRTRQSVSDLVHSFSVSGVKTDLSTSLQEDGEGLFQRAELFNALRDNKNMMILNRDSEEFFQVSTPLSTLDALQAQAQEHMAAVSRIPLVKLLGITPSGLNATDEGQIRSFYDWIHGFQELLLRKPITTMLGFIQLSEFGEVDKDIIFDFKPLWQLDESGKAAIQKTKADTHDAYIAMGVVGPEEVRTAIAADSESPYAGLDLDAELPPQIPSENDPPDHMGEEPKPGAEGTELEPGAKDPASRLATSIVNRSANVGGASGEGFKGQ
jgi:uncharacterized protein